MKNLHPCWRTPFFVLPLLFWGCIFTPSFVTEEGETCQLWTKELELEASSEVGGAIVEVMMEGFSHCNEPECLLVIPLAILVPPVTSGIVSGSIVVVGNTIHWVEEQGRCEDSLTRTTISALPATTLEAGGRVIQSGTDLIDWFQAHVVPDSQDFKSEEAQEEHQPPSGNVYFKSP